MEVGKLTIKFTMKVGFTIKSIMQVGKLANLSWRLANLPFTMEVGEFTTWKYGAVSNAVGERCGRLLERLQAPANSIEGDSTCNGEKSIRFKAIPWGDIQ